VLVIRRRLVSLAALLAISQLFGCGDDEASCSSYSVDRAEWRSALAGATDQSPPTEAEKIADDIVRCRMLVGLREKEVRALLGKPDLPASNLPGWDFGYFLGSERSRPAIDTEALVIELRSGRVQKAEIHTD
jgi:hypothetical protein